MVFVVLKKSTYSQPFSWLALQVIQHAGSTRLVRTKHRNYLDAFKCSFSDRVHTLSTQRLSSYYTPPCESDTHQHHKRYETMMNYETTNGHCRGHFSFTALPRHLLRSHPLAPAAEAADLLPFQWGGASSHLEGQVEYIVITNANDIIQHII